MIWEWLAPILILGVFGGVITWDAISDKTPRVPRRPEHPWWASRRSTRERLQAHVSIARGRRVLSERTLSVVGERSLVPSERETTV